MYTIKSKAIATGVIALSLFAAAPVFADTNVESNNGLHLGLFTKILRAEQRENRQEDRQQDRKDAREDAKQNHATSTNASTTKQFTIEGTVTFVSGSTLTVVGNHGATYSVNAANASVVGHNNVVLTLAALAVNDKVAVTGTLSNNMIIASKIKDKSDETGKTAKPLKVMRSVSAGIVTAINGASVTLSNFGSSGTTNLTTNTATKYFVKGSATSSAALTTGAHVLVLGTSTATSTGSVNASIIVILTEGLNWIKHLLK